MACIFYPYMSGNWFETGQGSNNPGNLQLAEAADGAYQGRCVDNAGRNLHLFVDDFTDIRCQ